VSTSRRTFLKVSAAAGGAVGLGTLPKIGFATNVPLEGSLTPAPVERAKAPLKILILGGTGFTGPEQVEYATARGHQVTLINRNKTRPEFSFKDRGAVDRRFQRRHERAQGRKFDVVIDNPTTHPGWVRNVAQYMKGNTDHYIFNLDHFGLPGQQSRVGRRDRQAVDDAGGIRSVHGSDADARRYYGAMKTVSESEVAQELSQPHDQFGRAHRREV